LISQAELLLQLTERARSHGPNVLVVTADEVAEWPVGALDALLADGVLREIQPAKTVVCDQCFDGHVEVVDFVEEPPGSMARAYIACAEAGRVAVDTKRMRRWRIAAVASTDGSAAEPSALTNVFVREGEFWTIGYQGKTSRLGHRKGFTCIAHLLRRPGVAVHAMELTSLVTRTGRGKATVGANHELGGPAREHPGEILDDAAVTAYRERAQELRDDIDDAERNNDPERSARAKEELDAVGDQLLQAQGLGGRRRTWRTNSERARVNVTNLIRTALKAIEKENAALAAFLTGSIRTGAFCSYEPAVPIVWSL